MKRCLVLTLVILVLCSVSLAIDILPKPGSRTAAEFLQERKQVFDYLQQQIEKEFPGVSARDQKIQFDDSQVGKSPDFPKRGHEVHRVYNWFVNFEEEAFPKSQQGNSVTMSATRILNHYFDGLKDLGFRNQGSPGVAMSAVQLSSNQWTREDRRIRIRGTVFSSPTVGQAIVHLEIDERFP